jgi:hypothetical protein
MHDTLRDPLVIEVEDLLPKMEVLQQSRPALAGSQRVLIIRNRGALLRRQPGHRIGRHLMRLATIPDEIDRVRVASRRGGALGRRLR